ncbi:MAG TPA: PKD domain-containing protein, partial [Myxococcaceae bacterium]
MNRRWVWLGAVVATGALADITPGSGLPFREDFESGLNGWTAGVDPSNEQYVSSVGESWSGAGALVVQAQGPLAPEASLSVVLPSPQGTLSVRFFLYVPEATRLSMVPQTGSIRLLREDGQVVGSLVTLDLVRALDGTLYLSPTVSGLNISLPDKTSLTTNVYHYVELTLNGNGTSALYIDDPRVPRVTLGTSATTFNAILGITSQVVTATSARLIYDDVEISDRHIGLAGTRMLVSNEYESPGLSFRDYPAGKAAGVLDAGAPAPQLVSQTFDVHRGSRAMRTGDQDQGSALQGAALYGFLDRGSLTPVYRRVWWRWPSVARMVNHTVFAIGDTDGGAALDPRFAAAVQIQDTGAARLWGVDDRGTALYSSVSVPLAQGPWHLLEIYADGFGTDAGVRQGWVDGISLGQQFVPFVQSTGDAWAEGVLPVAGEGTYAGLDSFDDARSSTYVQPTRFILKPFGTPTGCDPYNVESVTSENGSSPVPETVDVALDGGGTALFYTGPDCVTPSARVNSVRFNSGTSVAGVRVHALAPGLVLSTSSPDYLPWSNQAGPDAGTPGPASSLALRGLPLVALVGTGYPFGVEALDSAGATAVTYAGTVGFFATPTASLPPSHTFNAQDRGYFVFGGGVTFPSAGTYTVVVNDVPGGLITTSGPIRVLGPAQVAIVDDANRDAVVGRPYVYNAFGAVTAVSTAGPPVFSTCNVPVGFTVDSRTGAVSWVPVGQGTYSICVQAAAGQGQDQLRYLLDVAASPPGPPDAGFVVRWSPVAAGGFVVDDPVGSYSPAGPLLFRWRFGDGAWPGTDPQPFHRFALPGGYRTHLTVRDIAGQSAVADQPVQAGLARLAPTVRITSAQPLQGDNSVSATLSAQVTVAAGQSVAAYRWNLGDGTNVSGTLGAGQPVPDVPVSYGPGRWFPQLLVVDGTGLPATDKVEVVVSKDGAPPPDCLATIEPTAVFLSSAAPVLGARFRAFQLPTGAPLEDTDWRVDGQDQPHDQAVIPQTYDAGGWHHGELTVRDENGLRCRDSVDLPVL